MTKTSDLRPSAETSSLRWISAKGHTGRSEGEKIENGDNNRLPPRSF